MPPEMRIINRSALKNVRVLNNAQKMSKENIANNSKLKSLETNFPYWAKPKVYKFPKEDFMETHKEQEINPDVISFSNFLSNFFGINKK